LPVVPTVARPTIEAVLEVLQKHEVDLVLLAGYMKIVTSGAGHGL
jgi:folate-dependent phosphoribosylglycinamide formyltransferase PurN